LSVCQEEIFYFYETTDYTDFLPRVRRTREANYTDNKKRQKSKVKSQNQNLKP